MLLLTFDSMTRWRETKRIISKHKYGTKDQEWRFLFLAKACFVLAWETSVISVYLSICLSIYLSIYLSIGLSTFGSQHRLSTESYKGIVLTWTFLGKLNSSTGNSPVGGLTWNFPVNGLTGNSPLSLNGEFPVKLLTGKFPVRPPTGKFFVKLLTSKVHVKTVPL